MNRRHLLQALTAAVALAVAAAAPARAAADTYLPVTVSDKGALHRDELAGLVSKLKQAKPQRVVVLIHGFNTNRKHADRAYRQMAERLAQSTQGDLLRMKVVGVHWDSGVGGLGKWIPQALGHRVTSLLGFKRAVKNPYLDKVEAAEETGRGGTRELLLTLQQELPGCEIDILAHSLGAAVALSALAPEAGLKKDESPHIFGRGQELRLGLVGLLGADVDRDVFARRDTPRMRSALNMARVWWITVPQEGQADGILELRRGAGRPDALGNAGMELRREDYDALLARRGLVIERDNIPTWHDIADYFAPTRCERVVSAMLHLQGVDHPRAQSSVLARLDEVMAAPDAEISGFSGSRDSNVRMYAVWRTKRQAQPEAAAKEPETMVAGSRETLGEKPK